MQVFQGEGGDWLDALHHIEDLVNFYHWDEWETCHQARYHLHGTTLTYAKWVPFQHRSWENLKTLLLKHFQQRDLMVTYKAQFRLRQ